MSIRKQNHYSEYIADCQDRPKGVAKFKSSWNAFLNYIKQGRKQCHNECDSFSKLHNPTMLKESFLYPIGHSEDLVMAITLPDEVNGNDIKISVELRALDTNCKYADEGLQLNRIKESESRSIFSGIIQSPPNTTLQQISNMPLYFIKEDNKIETIVKPVRNNIPTTLNENMIVKDLYLKINFENISRAETTQTVDTLPFVFLPKSNSRNVASNDDSKAVCYINLIKDSFSTNNDSNVTNQAINDNPSNRATNNPQILKEQAHKEIDAQVSLVAKVTQEQQSSRTLVTDATTSVPICTIINDNQINADQLYYLKVPQNSPKFVDPKYTLMYDQDSMMSWVPSTTDDLIIKVINTKNKALASESDAENDDGSAHIKNDIDRTLNLLETAKNKLLGYLEQPFEVIELDAPREHEPVINSEHSAKTISTSLNSSSSKIHGSKATRNPAAQQKFFPGEVKQEKVKPNNFDGDSTILLEGQLFRSISEQIQDNIFKQRYSGDTISKTDVSDVQKDMDIMMEELLNESNNIKDLIAKSLNPKYSLNDIPDSANQEVRYILELLLENIQKYEDTILVPDVDPPNEPTAPLALRTSLIDEVLEYDDTKPLLACNLTENISYVQPLVSVLRKTSSKSSNISDENDENLTDHLERGSIFLSQIYNEICNYNGIDDNESEDNEDDDEDDDEESLVHIPESSSILAVSVTPKENTEDELKLMAEKCTVNVVTDESPTLGPTFLLGHAAKINEMPSKITTLSQERHEEEDVEDEEEEVQTTTDFQTINEKQSKHSNVSHRSRAVTIQSLSSSEEEMTVRKLRLKKKTSQTTTSTVQSKPVSRITGNADSSSLTLSNSETADDDYDADQETCTLRLPDLNFQYASKQELNNAEEIAYIEENVETNKNLTKNEEENVNKKLDMKKNTFSYHSFESDSFTVSPVSSASNKLSK